MLFLPPNQQQRQSTEGSLSCGQAAHSGHKIGVVVTVVMLNH